MPVYDYRCQQCGEFLLVRNINEAHLPAECSECGQSASRIISAPRLSLVSSATRIAHERNEKSAHKPLTAWRSSCGCSGKHTCSSTGSATQSGTGLQMQTKKTARPWMLGH
jgi:putative FmdB family regulatory protein